MKNLVKKIKSTDQKAFLFAAVVLICAICVISLLFTYFSHFKKPYLMGEVIDLSVGWEYETKNTGIQPLATLHTGPKLQSGETLTLYRTLEENIPQAALLIRANHQFIDVYLDGIPLYTDSPLASPSLATPNKAETRSVNPGIALHFVPLPEDYLNRTLSVEITSPYTLYAGRTSPILMGTIPSLEAYTLSRSMRSLILMSMCLLLGLCTLVLTFVQALKGFVLPQSLVMGIFAIIWALYYICTEYMVLQIFTPVQVSNISLLLYFSFQVPLTLFFYFSFRHYKKQMLPGVIIHSTFVVVALLLQFFGVVDLPQLININNILLAGLAYTIVLAVLEGWKRNHLIMLATPFLIIAYVSMLYNFVVFYTRHGVVPYSYKDTYFLFILSVLVFSIQKFYREYYYNLQESEMLLLQNRMARESYEQIKAHLQEVGGLKHDIKNHLSAMQAYLANDRYEEAKIYLSQYTQPVGAITNQQYHDHFLINTMADNLVRTAKTQDTTVELNLKASPLHITDPDLFNLFSNLLENAMEACANMPSGQNRFIHLTIARREPYLYITCVNSIAGTTIQSVNEMQSTKKEKGHGYGLWTIRRITERYDGLVDWEHDDTTFTLTVALKDPLGAS